MCICNDINKYFLKSVVDPARIVIVLVGLFFETNVKK